MNLPNFCIKRPAFTWVISLVMVIIGLIGFMNLPVRWIPNVNPPQITISTSYPGANARLVENDVTKVIEESLSGINGIESLTSTSRQGESQVNISFKLGNNINAAVEDVRSSIERVRGALPKDVQNPVVLKANPSNMPLLYLTFNSDRYNDRELSDYVDRYIAPTISTIDGVGSLHIFGKRVSAMRIWLDPAKMASAKVTVDEVTQLLREQNASIPSGQIQGNDRIYSVIADTALKTEQQFNDLIIRDNENQVLRLKDIGNAKWDAENTDSAFRIKGKSGIALGVVTQSTANPLDVEKRILATVSDIRHSLPLGMEVNVDYNQADYIRASIHSVYESLIEAVIFVWLVILAFLCSFRATIIPVITIPVCLMSTFAILYFLGFSINTITLMAFVLAIGLVVDDAIVMLENISRHIEEGVSPFKAALIGSREIILPIIAMTLTLTAVYAPIAFTPGLLGVLFREFTFTLAGAVLISGIVALTLSPMMCARLLKVSHAGRYARWFNQQFSRLQTKYQRMLEYLLLKRAWVLGFLGLVAGLGVAIYTFMPSELAPAEDMSEIDAFIAAPRNSSFQYTDSFVRQLEAIYQQNPDIISYLSLSGTFSSAHAYQLLKLKPPGARKATAAEIIESLSAEADRLPGVRVNVFSPPPPLAEYAGSDNGDNIGLVLMTTGDYRKLQQVTAKIMDAIKQIPGILHVDNRLKWDSEQFRLNIDRNKAADLKISIPNTTQTIATLLAGSTIGKTGDANILVQMNKDALANPNVFEQMYVRNSVGTMVPLTAFLTIDEGTAPDVFNHYERLRADTIYITLSPTLKIANAIKALQTVARENLPDDIKYSFVGEAKSFLESNGKTLFTFGLALVFIYLVLVAQFESFIDPFIILLTVPFAVVGAMLTLKLFGGSLNIYSNIGLITLIGLIAKHGILITEFANRLRANGKEVRTAVIEASLLRLRPILMTTAAMVLGALPLALAYGPGAENRQQIGLVITGGLLIGTFFSLVVVPIMYTYLSPLRKSLLTIDQ